MSKKDPYMEINRHLKMVRAMPHPTMGKVPAELLFGRSFQTKVPDLRRSRAKDRDLREAQETERKEKAQQKRYKDRKATVRGHRIKVRDNIQLKRKTTKDTSPYDPRPYKAADVRGTQITGERDGTTKTRDSQKWKKVTVGKARVYRKEEPETDMDPDIGVPRRAGQGQQTGQAQQA